MHTGEKKIEIGGKKVTLVYDWKAISRAQAAHGSEVFNLLLSSGPEVVADVLAIGLEKSNPEMTAEAILELSPPLIPAINAIHAALSVAYWGPDGPPKDKKGGKDNGKKTR